MSSAYLIRKEAKFRAGQLVFALTKLCRYWEEHTDIVDAMLTSKYPFKQSLDDIVIDANEWVDNMDIDQPEPKERVFPNGFQSWIETHHEIVAGIAAAADIEGTHANKRREEQGTGGLWEMGEELTDLFESQYHNEELEDGGFLEIIEDFIEEHVHGKNLPFIEKNDPLFVRTNNATNERNEIRLSEFNFRGMIDVNKQGAELKEWLMDANVGDSWVDRWINYTRIE